MSLTSQILADNPVHFYQFQEAAGATTFADSGSGVSTTRSLSGTYAFGVAGPQTTPDTALGFTSGHANILHDADMNIIGDVTLECMVYPINFSGYWFIIAKTVGNGGSHTPYEWRLTTGSGVPQFGRNGTFANGTLPPVLNMWNHMAVTRSGTVITHYLNGNLNGVGSLATIGAVTNTSPLKIGSREDLHTQSNMRFAYAAIYPTALSEARIVAHYFDIAWPTVTMSLSQQHIEVLRTGGDVTALLSHQYLEVLRGGGSADALLSQQYIEVLRTVGIVPTGTINKLTPTIM